MNRNPFINPLGDVKWNTFQLWNFLFPQRVDPEVIKQGLFVFLLIAMYWNTDKDTIFK